MCWLMPPSRCEGKPHAHWREYAARNIAVQDSTYTRQTPPHPFRPAQNMDRRQTAASRCPELLHALFPTEDVPSPKACWHTNNDRCQSHCPASRKQSPIHYPRHVSRPTHSCNQIHSTQFPCPIEDARSDRASAAPHCCCSSKQQQRHHRWSPRFWEPHWKPSTHE